MKSARRSRSTVLLLCYSIRRWYKTTMAMIAVQMGVSLLIFALLEKRGFRRNRCPAAFWAGPGFSARHCHRFARVSLRVDTQIIGLDGPVGSALFLRFQRYPHRLHWTGGWIFIGFFLFWNRIWVRHRCRLQGFRFGSIGRLSFSIIPLDPRRLCGSSGTIIRSLAIQ